MIISKKEKNMSLKITMTSSDSNYRSFEEWFDQKTTEFVAAGNDTTAEAWISAMRAKSAAEEAADATVTKIDANSVVLNKQVVVEAFDAIFTQWVAQYNVQFTYEEIE